MAGSRIMEAQGAASAVAGRDFAAREAPHARPIAARKHQLIVGAYNADPFAVLGPHRVMVDGRPGWAVRAFLPWAASVQVAQQNGTVQEMERMHPDGLFEARHSRRREVRLRAARHGPRRPRGGPGRPVFVRAAADRFRPVSDRRRHATTARMRSWARISARWAACAACTSPFGRRTRSGSAWSATSTTGMGASTRCGCTRRRASGRLFMPELGEGEAYKYEIKSRFNDYRRRQGRPLRLLRGAAPAHGLGGGRPGPLRLGRRRVDGSSGATATGAGRARSRSTRSISARGGACRRTATAR